MCCESFARRVIKLCKSMTVIVINTAIRGRGMSPTSQARGNCSWPRETPSLAHTTKSATLMIDASKNVWGRNAQIWCAHRQITVHSCQPNHLPSYCVCVHATHAQCYQRTVWSPRGKPLYSLWGARQHTEWFIAQPRRQRGGRKRCLAQRSIQVAVYNIHTPERSCAIQARCINNHSTHCCALPAVGAGSGYKCISVH